VWRSATKILLETLIRLTWKAEHLESLFRYNWDNSADAVDQELDEHTAIKSKS
jgi:hypothetical protein